MTAFGSRRIATLRRVLVILARLAVRDGGESPNHLLTKPDLRADLLLTRNPG